MTTILIVDDVSSNRDLLKTVLLHQGYEVLEAVDGESALTSVRARQPDLVVTDVLMPVMDGYELVRRMRQDPATRNIPVVFHTAHYGEREARELAFASGVTSVLTKPAPAAVVVETVQHALAGTLPKTTAAPPGHAVSREHLRLLTDKLAEEHGLLRSANARLRALINIGMDLASEPDSDRLLESVCVAAHDLFGVTYVTLGLTDRNAVRRVLSYGTDATGRASDAPWIGVGELLPGLFVDVVDKRMAVMGDNPGGNPVSLELPMRHPSVCSYLVAPVASPGRVYGWLALVCNDERCFDEEDKQVLTALGGLLGRVYEASRLYHAGQTRAGDLERELLATREAMTRLVRERNAALTTRP